MAVSESPIVKVKTLSKKMAEQIRIVYPDSEVKEVHETAMRLLLGIENRRIFPIGWVNWKLIGGDMNIVVWLVEFGNQFYWLERPAEGSAHWHESFGVHRDVPQLFIG
jgi:hypothetical protein